MGLERCLRSWRALKLWRCADTWRAHQGVDDDHGGSAVRTGEGWRAGTGRPIIALRFGLGAWRFNLQQLTCPLEVVAALGVGNKPIVADAVEAPNALQCIKGFMQSFVLCGVCCPMTAEIV